MSATKLPYGRPVKLLIDFQGFPDGRLVQFEVWRKTNQGEEKVTQVNGVTKGGKAYAMWNPDFGEHTVELKASESEIQEKAEEEKYYFFAKIDDQEAKSGDLEFTFPLGIYLKDNDGRPLHGVNYTVTFSDGRKQKGTFLDGRASFKGVPMGKFKIEVDGYTPSTLHGVVKRWA